MWTIQTEGMGSPMSTINYSALADPPVDAPGNDGFVRNYTNRLVATWRSVAGSWAASIRPGFQRSRSLVEEFAVCDQWFSSVPGPTWPNRFFAHCGTSDGVVNMGFKWYVRRYRMKTVYDSLDEAGVDWRIYFHDIPQSLALSRLRSAPALRVRFRKFGHFAADAADGALPPYTFIEPRYFNFFKRKANDQHPPHDVRLGEHLIADVYEALRNGPQWKGPCSSSCTMSMEGTSITSLRRLR